MDEIVYARRGVSYDTFPTLGDSSGFVLFCQMLQTDSYCYSLLHNSFDYTIRAYNTSCIRERLWYSLRNILCRNNTPLFSHTYTHTQLMGVNMAGQLTQPHHTMHNQIL